jgi:hypothetical protein
MHDRTGSPQIRPDLPGALIGLLPRLGEGGPVRVERVVAVRERLRRGEHPAPHELADAVVAEGVPVAG